MILKIIEEIIRWTDDKKILLVADQWKSQGNL